MSSKWAPAKQDGGRSDGAAGACRQSQRRQQLTSRSGFISISAVCSVRARARIGRPNFLILEKNFAPCASPAMAARSAAREAIVGTDIAALPFVVVVVVVAGARRQKAGQPRPLHHYG